MAKIPRVGSQQSAPTTQTTQNKVSPDSGGIAARALGQLGNNIQSVSSKIETQFRQTDSLRESMAAEVEANDAMNNLKLKVESETDLDAVEGIAQEELKRIQGQIGTKIKDREARERFNYKYGLLASNQMYDIRSNLRQRKNEQAVSVFNTTMDNLERSYYQAGEGGQKQIIADQIRESYSEAVTAGLLTGAQASAKLKEKLDSMRIGQVYSDAESYGAAYALEGLSQGGKGIYKNLTPEERGKMTVEFTKLAEKARKEEEQAWKDAEDLTEREVAIGLTSGTIKQADLDGLLGGQIGQDGTRKRISLSFYKSAKESLQNPFNDPEIPADEKLKKIAELDSMFTELVRDPEVINSGFERKYGAASGNSIESVQAFRKKVLEYAPALTREEAYDRLAATQGNLNEALMPRVSAVQMIANYAKGIFVDKDTLGPLPRLASELFSRIKDPALKPQDIREVAKEVIKDDIRNQNPDIAALDDVPNSVFENATKQKLYPGTSKLTPTAADSLEEYVVVEKEGSRQRIPKKNLGKAIERGWSVPK